MKLTTVNIQEGLLEALDWLVEKGYYPSRAEAIRIAVGLLVDEHRSFRQMQNFTSFTRSMKNREEINDRPEDA